MKLETALITAQTVHLAKCERSHRAVVCEVFRLFGYAAQAPSNESLSHRQECACCGTELLWVWNSNVGMRLEITGDLNRLPHCNYGDKEAVASFVRVFGFELPEAFFVCDSCVLKTQEYRGGRPEGLQILGNDNSFCVEEAAMMVADNRWPDSQKVFIHLQRCAECTQNHAFIVDKTPDYAGPMAIVPCAQQFQAPTYYPPHSNEEITEYYSYMAICGWHDNWNCSNCLEHDSWMARVIRHGRKRDTEPLIARLLELSMGLVPQDSSAMVYAKDCEFCGRTNVFLIQEKPKAAILAEVEELPAWLPKNKPVEIQNRKVEEVWPYEFKELFSSTYKCESPCGCKGA